MVLPAACDLFSFVAHELAKLDNQIANKMASYLITNNFFNVTVTFLL